MTQNARDPILHGFEIDDDTHVPVALRIEATIDQIKKGKYKNADVSVFVGGGDTLFIREDGYPSIARGNYFGPKQSCELEELQQFKVLVDTIKKEREEQQ